MAKPSSKVAELNTPEGTVTAPLIAMVLPSGSARAAAMSMVGTATGAARAAAGHRASVSASRASARSARALQTVEVNEWCGMGTSCFGTTRLLNGKSAGQGALFTEEGRGVKNWALLHLPITYYSLSLLLNFSNSSSMGHCQLAGSPTQCVKVVPWTHRLPPRHIRITDFL